MREMHKSVGNVIWADEAIEKIGADIMRWMYCLQNPSQSMPFGYTPAKDVRRTLNVLYNTVKFLQTYCEVNKYKPKKPKTFDISSQWILARLQTVKKEVTDDLENLKPHLASCKLEEFFLNDLSRWYGHIIREYIKPGLDSNYKEMMLYTLYKTCLDTLKLLSPFIPFITESLYQDFFSKFEKEESIHLCDWPEVEKDYVNDKLEKEMIIAKKIVEATNAIRHKENIKLRYILSSLTVDGNKELKETTEDLKEVIEEMTNIKEVKIGKMEDGKDIENGKLLLNTEVTQDIRNEWLLSELIRSAQDARKKMKLEIKDKVELYLLEDELFSKNKKKIESSTGSKITFGKIIGNKFDFEFLGKKYEFGIKI